MGERQCSIPRAGVPGSSDMTQNNSCMDELAWRGGPTRMDFLLTYRSVISLWICLPTSIVGFVTSILCISMFLQDRLTPGTTRILLIATATADSIFLPSVFSNLLCNLFYKVLGNTCHSIAGLFGNVSELQRNWLVVILGVERFLLICHPLQFKRVWNRKRVAAIIGCVAVGVIVLRIPVILFYFGVGDGNILRKTHTIFDSVFLTLIPLCILSLCGVRIFITLRNPYLQIPIGRQITDKRSRVNRVILAALSTFMVFMLPSIPLTVLQLMTWNSTMAPCGVRVSMYIAAYLASLGTALNSTANFFVYVLYSQRYRHILLSMLQCKRPASDTIALNHSAGIDAWSIVRSFRKKESVPMFATTQKS